MPDPELSKCGQDITVIFEQSYARMNSASLEEQCAQSNYDRTKACYMIHSIPRADISMATREARLRGEHVFATVLNEKYYESFGNAFDDFITAMAAP